jgi:hypothetical protein
MHFSALHFCSSEKGEKKKKKKKKKKGEIKEKWLSSRWAGSCSSVASRLLSMLFVTKS